MQVTVGYKFASTEAGVDLGEGAVIGWLHGVVLKAGMPESRKARMPECRNAGNQDPEILKPGMTFREGKRAK